MEADTIKQVEMKEKNQKEYCRRTRKLLETKLCSRNLMKGRNTWAVPLVRYLGKYLKWTREELNQITRKLMTTHKALDPSDGVDILYISRMEGGRGLCKIENSVYALLQRLKKYIEKHEGELFTAIGNNTVNTMANRMIITRKQK